MAATALSNRAASSRALSLFRQSFNFLRSLSTAAASPTTGGAASKKPKRTKKKKNLFEVAQFLPNWGTGYHMAKTHWTGVSYQITKINLYKAWGLVHKDGLPAVEVPKKISGIHKCCWRYIPNLTSTGSSPSIGKDTEDSMPKIKAQVA